MFIAYWSSLTHPNQRLQVILTGTLILHLLVLLIVQSDRPHLKNRSTLPASSLAIHVSLTPSNDRNSTRYTTTAPTLRKRTICAQSKNIHDKNYMMRWQAYVESFGNEYYPSRALKENMQGTLSLLVAIEKNGTIKEVKIRQSSGSSFLDDAAIHIVRKAAPFEPLPPEISQEVDVLEIIRTWKFTGSRHTVVH